MRCAGYVGRRDVLVAQKRLRPTVEAMMATKLQPSNLFVVVCDTEECHEKSPYKLWDGRHSVRKGLVVGSLEELVRCGRDKLGVSVGEPVELVLESNGTQVDDAKYFRTLPANTTLLLLRPGERWLLRETAIDDNKPPHRFPKQGSSLESATIHIHMPECAHQPRAGSPQNNGANECDFHCCTLHKQGRKIVVQKNVTTSPIHDAQQQPSPQPKSSRHVRFLDIEEGGGSDHHSPDDQHGSSVSETENSVMEDEAITSEKFLLLIDQKHHLSVKDIGVILDKLSSKILDVEQLARQSASDDTYYWTIKATIEGNVFRELGVIYNDNYYAISEHPGYKDENEGGVDEDEEKEDECCMCSSI